MAAGAVKGKPGVSTDWRAARARSRQTAELWVASGLLGEGKPQQQSATELERERAGCSECSNSYSTSKSQLGVGGGQDRGAWLLFKPGGEKGKRTRGPGGDQATNERAEAEGGRRGPRCRAVTTTT